MTCTDSNESMHSIANSGHVAASAHKRSAYVAMLQDLQSCNVAKACRRAGVFYEYRADIDAQRAGHFALFG
jgi:hypothetical protein